MWVSPARAFLRRKRTDLFVRESQSVTQLCLVMAAKVCVFFESFFQAVDLLHGESCTRPAGSGGAIGRHVLSHGPRRGAPALALVP